jgi:cold shock CspA family protein
MGRAKETFGKKEVRNKQLKKRKEKEKRKLERKESGKKSGLDDMLAWVDANGQIVSSPPSDEERAEVKAENIEISVPKGGAAPIESANKGRVKNFDTTKGFGFITTMQMQDDIFFHINDCLEEIKQGDKIEFETEKGVKGLKAVKIKKI